MRLAERMARRERRRKNTRAARRARRTPHSAPDPGLLMEWVPKIRKGFRQPTHLGRLVADFERGMREPGTVRGAYSFPVRHGKTELLKTAIPWILAKDPTRAVLYCSYAHGFAKKQTTAAKAVARKAGVALGRGRRGDEWHTKAGGFVKAAGIGGQITGEGFTDIILDDPHKNRAEAESRVIREGVIEAFFSDIFTRRDPRGTNFYVVHARWNVNDLIGVLARMEPHPFEYYNAPAISAEGEALAPWLFDVDELRELEATLGPYVFASLYQGSPRPRGGALFGSPTLALFGEPFEYQTAIGFDLCRSASERSDYNAAVVQRKDLRNDRIDVVRAVRARGTLTPRQADDFVVDEGFVRQCVPLLHEHPGAALAMYAAENERALVKLFSRELSDAVGWQVEVEVLPIVTDKFLRAQSYAAAWNKKRVRLPGRRDVKAEHTEHDEIDDGRDRAGWVNAFSLEHVEFTGVKGEINDQVDAAAAAFDKLEMGVEETSLAEAMAAVRSN